MLRARGHALLFAVLANSSNNLCARNGSEKKGDGENNEKEMMRGGDGRDYLNA